MIAEALEPWNFHSATRAEPSTTESTLRNLPPSKHTDLHGLSKIIIVKSTEVQNPRLLSMTRALCSGYLLSIDDFTLAMRTPLGV